MTCIRPAFLKACSTREFVQTVQLQSFPWWQDCKIVPLKVFDSIRVNIGYNFIIYPRVLFFCVIGHGNSSAMMDSRH